MEWQLQLFIYLVKNTINYTTTSNGIYVYIALLCQSTAHDIADINTKYERNQS